MSSHDDIYLLQQRNKSRKRKLASQPSHRRCRSLPNSGLYNNPPASDDQFFTERTIDNSGASKSTSNGIESLIDSPKSAAASPNKNKGSTPPHAPLHSSAHQEGAHFHSDRRNAIKTRALGQKKGLIASDTGPVNAGVQHAQQKPQKQLEHQHRSLQLLQQRRQPYPQLQPRQPQQHILSAAKMSQQMASRRVLTSQMPSQYVAKHQQSFAPYRVQPRMAAGTAAGTAFINTNGLAQYIPATKSLAHPLARHPFLVPGHLHVPKQKKKREKYKCKLCHQFKKGHICPEIAHFKREKGQRRSIATQTEHLYTASKLRKKKR